MPESLRLFFAVPLDDSVRSAVAKVRDDLRRVPGPVKWVEDANLHFTLKFLGETPVGLIPKLRAVAEAVGQRHAVIDLSLRGIGAFPNARAPRVVWVGLAEGAEPLSALADDLDNALAEASLAPRETRPFAAHVTFGRVREPVRRDELTAEIELAGALDFGQMRCDHFVLMRSELSRRGPTYTELERFNLREDA